MTGNAFAGERVLIAGLDPHVGGGVPAMMLAAARNIRALGGSPDFVHLAQPYSGLRDGMKFQWERSTCFGLPYRRTPNTYLSYLGPGLHVRDLSREYDSLFLVGVAQSGVLLALDGRPYPAWLATTAADEYRARSWRRELHDRNWGLVMNSATMPLTLILERMILGRCRPLYALSRATQRSFADDYGLAGSTYLPFPIDVTHFTPGPRAREPVVLYVGRIDDHRKNVKLLLRAFQLVRKRVPAAELWLVGSYQTDGAVAKLSEAIGCGTGVRLLGEHTREQLPSIYRRAAVFALPSRQEGLGIVVLEAMAAGVPVVSTKCGGPEADVIESGAGTLVEQDDAVAFASALLEVIADSDHRAMLSEKARSYIETAHSDEAFQEILTSAGAE